MKTSAIAFPTKLDDSARQAALVTHKLQGEKIKAALLMNPGKVIICPRQSGKSTGLMGYIQDVFADGAIIYTVSEDQARNFKKGLGKEIFNKSTIVWGNVYPNLAGINQPIFADEICWLGGTRQKEIVRHPNFMGAVSSASSFTEPEVKDICILS